MFYKLGSEDVEVHGITKRIECFVGVFDGEFVDSWICDASVLDGAVEMCAMAGSLMRWEDEELRDAETSGELCYVD